MTDYTFPDDYTFPRVRFDQGGNVLEFSVHGARLGSELVYLLVQPVNGKEIGREKEARMVVLAVERVGAEVVLLNEQDIGDLTDVFIANLAANPEHHVVIVAGDIVRATLHQYRHQPTNPRRTEQ